MVDSARWNDFEFRDDDIVISTPPKSGTTWTQMICALLIFRKPRLSQPLTLLSPWLDMDAADLPEILEGLEAQEHRRFIKTHTPLDGLPYRREVTYLCTARDPRDAFMSMDNHHKNMRPEFVERMLEALRSSEADSTDPNHADEEEPSTQDTSPLSPEEALRIQFREWIADDGLPWRDDRPMGAPSVFHHVQSFWTYRNLPNIHLIHYSDLLRDLEGEMRRIARLLEIQIDEDLWPDLIEAATFEKMKEKAETLAPESDKDMWTSREQFFHKGTSGQWRSVLGNEELSLYRAAMKERLDPDLAEWLEEGRHRTKDDAATPT